MTPMGASLAAFPNPASRMACWSRAMSHMAHGMTSASLAQMALATAIARRARTAIGDGTTFEAPQEVAIRLFDAMVIESGEATRTAMKVNEALASTILQATTALMEGFFVPIPAQPTPEPAAAPKPAAPVIATPVITAPVIADPVITAPVIAAPVIETPILAAAPVMPVEPVIAPEPPASIVQAPTPKRPAPMLPAIKLAPRRAIKPAPKAPAEATIPAPVVAAPIAAPRAIRKPAPGRK